MKKITLLLLMLMSIGILQAQKIKFKKGIVFIDGKECLKYDSSDPNNVVISNLEESQTVYLKFIRTGIGQNGGLFTKIIFAEQNKSFTSRSYIFTKKLLINKFLTDGILNDCIFDISKVDTFIMRYDENIESTLIRF